MIRICVRATYRSNKSIFLQQQQQQQHTQRCFSGTQWRKEDPRLDDSGRKITDEFATLKEKYGKLIEHDTAKCKLITNSSRARMFPGSARHDAY